MKERKKQRLPQNKVFKNSQKLARLIKLASTKNYSSSKLAGIFNCNKKTIFKALKANSVFLPNLGRFKKRIYCNTDFFVKLSPISAYWAGFIAADGCLSHRGKMLSIGLNRQDAGHLNKFAKAINTNAKIWYTKSNNSVHISIYSEKVFDSLLSLGITPNKSLSIGNVNIPYNLISHFIRGVFDGDGYIGGRKITHIQFFISGNGLFLQQIQNVLVKECGINKVNLYPLYPLDNNKGYKLQYTGSQVFRILNFLYKGSFPKTRLERKYRGMLKLRKKFGKHIIRKVNNE